MNCVNFAVARDSLNYPNPLCVSSLHSDGKCLCETCFFSLVQLYKLGFKQQHALDASQGMLDVARQKKVYTKDFCCYLDHTRLPIEDGRLSTTHYLFMMVIYPNQNIKQP